MRSSGGALRGVASAVLGAAALSLAVACSAFAAGGVSLCIPEAEGAATVTPTKGACAAKYKLVELGAEGKEGKEGTFAGLTAADKETLLAILPYVKFVKEGIDKKPTIQFSDANVQIVSGAAKESELNGRGNLVVGKDEAPRAQTGSNNLVVGTTGQSFTSFGGLLAGEHDTITASAASVSGEYDTASGLRASVSGGYDNTASAEGASVSGGQVNVASGIGTSVSGGIVNEASGTGAWAAGGGENKASGLFASISGGGLNVATGLGSSVSGGYTNTAHGEYASIVAGEANDAVGNYAAILGGEKFTLTTEFGQDY